MSAAPDGDAGAAGQEASASESTSDAATPDRDERIRLMKAAALGFALGLVLARWGTRQMLARWGTRQPDATPTRR